MVSLLLSRCCSVARQDPSPEACAVHGSNKHNSRVGEGEVHLHLDFLLFTKRHFSGGCTVLGTL